MGGIVSSLVPLLTAVVAGSMRPPPAIPQPPGVQHRAILQDFGHEEEVQRMRHELEEAKRRADTELEKRQEAERLVREAQARLEGHARAEEERRKAAEDELKRSQEEATKAEERVKKAAEDIQKAQAAQAEAERNWKAGIPPEILPTREQIEAVKRERQYTEGLFHFAVAGGSGAGKSSLINALLGRQSNDRDSAATGVVQTTSAITRYHDTSILTRGKFVWYDVPGTNVLDVPDWTYFNDQGLYIFDCILIVMDSRFTASDIAIIKNCVRWNIPSYIIRSKSDQHIRNLTEDMLGDEDCDETEVQRIRHEARTKYINDTRRNVKENLTAARLPEKEVYLVSCKDLRRIIKWKNSIGVQLLDEKDLLADLLRDVYERRIIKSGR